MNRTRVFALFASIALLLTGCGSAVSNNDQPAPGSADAGGSAPAPQVTITVSAAASLKAPLEQIQASFEATNPSVKVRLNLASSGALQQQIEQGAPTDLFISAAKSNVDALVQKGLVEESAVRPLVVNKPVLIRSKSTGQMVTRWEDLSATGVTRVAIGNPEHTPIGKYATSIFQHLSLTDALQQKLVLGEVVQQVVTYVESGEAQAGVVFQTDAALSDKVEVIAEAPAGSHPEALYPMAVVKASQYAAQAQLFGDYLLSADGMKVLEQYGFQPAK